MGVGGWAADWGDDGASGDSGWRGESVGCGGGVCGWMIQRGRRMGERVEGAGGGGKVLFNKAPGDKTGTVRGGFGVEKGGGWREGGG